MAGSRGAVRTRCGAGSSPLTRMVALLLPAVAPGPVSPASALQQHQPLFLRATTSLSISAHHPPAVQAGLRACPAGFTPHTPGYWDNSYPKCPCSWEDTANGTVALCAQKCRTWSGGGTCVAFENNTPEGNRSLAACFLFMDSMKSPFTPYDPPGDNVTTCVIDGYKPPPPPPLVPPVPRRSTGIDFPRKGSCWGSDVFITDKMLNYIGFPAITNDTWARYDTIYINPFDSCCYLKEMGSWQARIRAIKKGNPNAKVLATFHATEIWAEDINIANRWLPPKCLVRNSDGTPCSWWVGLVFTNNLFIEECWQYAVDNALRALDGGLVEAGIDGVFLDGFVSFTEGCKSTPNVNCECAPATTPTGNCNCSKWPPPVTPATNAQWVQKYVQWFDALKAKHPQLLWVNNIDTSFADEIQNISNGRQIEGSYNLAESPGLNSIIDGTFPISNFVDYIASWDHGERAALKPTLLHVSVNSLIQGGWRVGRWQNLATKGEMMLRLTHFARMRMGLGVALLSNAYFANDIGGGFYGVPSWYTEYECDLGAATHDSSIIYESLDDPKAQVWSRLFEKGIVIVNRLPSSNFTVKLPRLMRQISLSKNRSMLTDQREAPAWQLIIDNVFRGDEQPPLAAKAPLRLNQVALSKVACVCSTAAPACCPKPAGIAMDWWADSARRAHFFFIPGPLPWTTVKTQGVAQAHQLGNSYVVSFNDPGLFPQGQPPSFAAGWFFVAPSTDYYRFAMDKVDTQSYPLSDGTLVCLRESKNDLVAPFAKNNGADCIATGSVDQLNSVRDGGWQTALSHVPLEFNVSYEFIVEWDSCRGGYAAADALLVESESLYNGAQGTMTEVTVGAMDSRILLS